MKKKILIILLMLLICPLKTRGITYTQFNEWYDNDEKLVYNIDYVELIGRKLHFKGWAYIEGVNTIGGQNYKISIIAKKNDPLGEELEKVTADVYSGGHELYSSTCLRNTDNNLCSEVYHHFYEYDDGGVPVSQVGNGTYDNNVNRASCTNGYNCINYNPRFDISFDIGNLKKKIENDDKIIFIIEINYKLVNSGNKIEEKTSGNKCRFDYKERKYINCDGRGDISEGRIVRRVLAFHKEALNVTSGSILGVNISSMENIQFINTTDKGRLHTENNYNAIDFNYFEHDKNNNNRFNIETSKVRDVEDRSLGINYKTRWYGMKVKNTRTVYVPAKRVYLNYYTNDNNGTLYHAPSTWGMIDGLTSLEIKGGPEPENESCQFSEYITDRKGSNACTQYPKLHVKCQNVKFSDSMETTVLNDEFCEQKGEITVIRTYDFDETSKLDTKNIFKQVDSDGTFHKAWPGIFWDKKIEYTFTREVDWSADANYYYKVIRYYDKNTLPGEQEVNCEKEEGYVNEGYLSRINLTELKASIEEQADKYIYSMFYNSTNKEKSKSAMVQHKNMKLGIPDSSNYFAGEYNNDNSKIIKVNNTKINNSIEIDNISQFEEEEKRKAILNEVATNNKFISTENFILKDAYLYGTDIQYSDRPPGIEYKKNDKGNYYRFAFNIKLEELTDGLDFGVGMDNASLLCYKSSGRNCDPANLFSGKIKTGEDIELKSWCLIKISPGNLETMNYRVIDLSNPFPNVKPTLDPTNSRAVNWYNLWTSSSGFKNGSDEGKKYLYDRTQEANRELYTVDLSPTNIAAIRQYNEEQLKEVNGKKTYINAELNDDGSSVYIRDNLSIFKFEEPRIVMYDVGKGEAN